MATKRKRPVKTDPERLVNDGLEFMTVKPPSRSRSAPSKRPATIPRGGKALKTA